MPALLGSHLAQTGSLVSFEDSFTEDARRQGGGDDQDKFTPNPSTRGTGKPGHQKKQILFIDAAVPSCESLISGTLQGVETVVLHPREEGVGQIGAVLAGRSGLQSLHIVSHGSPGSIQLGSTKLNGDTIHTYANQLQQWAEALAGTDILIYGCSVAAGAGSAFLEELHRLTGANIAASATPTGSAAKGGDWNLEVRIGEITTGKAFEPAVLRDYTGIFNQDPLLLNPIADLSVTKNVPINYSIASAFSDPENDPIQYYATLANGNPLPTWLHFDSSTGTFSGTPGNANIGTIAVKVCATNSGGFSASGASDTFNLTVSNFAPATASPIADQTATAGTLFNFIIPGNTFSDADSDPLSYTATLANGNPLPSWLNFSNGTFSGNPGNSDAGTISVKVIASDTSNSSVSDIFNLTVQSSNPPALANLIPDQIARKGANYKFDINNIFSNGTNYSATLANGSPLPGWLSFSSYNLTFSGTPPTGETGTYSIKVSAQDGFGNPITDIFNLTVANSEPVLVNPIADQITRRGLSLSSSTNPFNFSIGNAFSDADNDQLHYTATLADGSPLPVWLSFNQDYGTFSGTPRDIDVGTISIKVTASDSPNAGAGAGVSDIFNLTVANSEPVLVNPIADQITRRGLSLSSSTNPFNFSIGSAFSDADNDRLYYRATLADGSPLPVWLSFYQDYGTFSGTPRDIDVGTISIKVTASDSPNAGAGAGVSDIFNLTVANSEPVLVNPIADQITRRGLSLSSSTNPFNFSIGSAFSDADNDQLHYTATLADGSPLPVWLSFNQDYGTFSGTPRDIDVGTISIKVTASDSPNPVAGAGVSDIFNLTVANSEPVLVNPIADQITRRGLSLSSSTNPFNFSIGSAFSDADNDQLHYRATLADGSPLPVWLSFNQDYGTFSGTPRDIDVGTISIKVTASDSPNPVAGAGVSDIFNLTVANSEPVLVNPIADQITRRGLSLSSSTNPFNFSIGSAFSDADNDQLHYRATLADGSPLPVWLSFYQDYGTFSGTPRDIDVGTISIKVTASDSPNAGAGAGVSDIFNLTVANSEPTVANPIPNQIAIVQAPFNYSIANTFSDADSDPLYYSATLADGSPLPGWLHFDSYSRSLTGTPGGGNTGTISVKVTASDSAYGPAGAGVSDTFDLTVASTAPPVVNPIADQTVKAGAPFDLSIGSAFNTSGGPLYYSATLANGNPLPYWLGFDSYTGTFHSTSNNWEGIGTTSIKVTASYGSPASPSASDIFDLTLTDSPPAVVNPIADLALKAGAPFDLSIGSAFNTSGGPLYYSATLANGNPLPYWLGFDSNTGTFHSTSNNWEGIGTTSIKVTASYGSPASPSASDIFDLRLTDSPPAVVNPIADLALKAGGTFDFSIRNSFSDADNNPLYYSATLANGNPLPYWLGFDSNTGTFHSTSNNWEGIGTTSIKVTASYGSPASPSASDIFDLRLTDSPPAVVNPIADLALKAGGTFDFSIRNSFSDADNNPLYYSATLANGNPLPYWLGFDSNTGTFHSTSNNWEGIGTTSIKVTASYGSPASPSASDIFDLRLTDSPPAVVNPIADLALKAGGTFDFSIRNSFSDADNNPLYYSATLANGNPLPYWLGFDSNTGTFHSTSNNWEGIGTTSIKVTASYGSPASPSASDIFDLRLTDSPPAVVNPIADLALKAGGTFDFSIRNSFSDADNNPLYYSATLANGNPLPYWLGFDSNTGTFHSTSNNWEGIGTTSIKVTASYGSPASPSASDIFDLTLTDSPLTLLNPLPDRTVGATPLCFNIGSAFSDGYNSQLYYTATLANGNPLPYWLQFDSNTGTFSSNYGPPEIGTTSIKVTAAGTPSANSPRISDIFNLTVNPSNALTLTNTIADQTTAKGVSFNFNIDSAFSNASNYSATLASGSPLPGWLSFNPTNRTFYGTPSNGDVGTIGVKVTAQGSGGNPVTDIFNLTVTNSEPVVATPIADQTFAKNTPVNFSISNAFSDANHDPLYYSAFLANGSPLPSWLSFNSSTGTFTGTPGNAYVGTVSIKVIAADTPSSGPGVTTVSDIFNLTVTNSEPVVATPIADQTFAKNTPVNFSISNAFSDANHDPLYYSATLANGSPLPSWLSFNSSTGTFTGTPGNAYVGTVSIKVIAADTPSSGPGANIVSDTFNLTVTNSSPVVATPIADQTFAKNTPVNFSISNAFSDANHDPLYYSATLANGSPLPSWLSFNSSTGTFTGTPGNAYVGTVSIKVIAADTPSSGPGVTTVSDIFNLTVTNSEPVVATPIADQTFAKNTPVNFSISNAFSDANHDPLYYSATLANGSPLPSWLSFNSSTGTFTGTPGNAYVGTVSIKVIAADTPSSGPGVTTVSDIFNLTVTNSEPVVATPIADQTFAKNTPVNFSISNAFSDANHDPLYYSATLANGSPLPSWLSFNSSTGTFSGTPGNANVGTTSIKVIAADAPSGPGANIVSDTFNLTVTNSEPVVATPIADQTVAKNTPVNFSIGNAFSDANNDPLTYSAFLANGSPLPSWLSFNSNTGTFTGTPGNAYVGTVSIKVIAADTPSSGPGVTTVSDIFNLTVTNSEPVVATPIADQTFAKNTPVNFSISNAFSDANHDPLYYSATLANGSPLPSWLSFNSSTGTFSGTPGNANVGTTSIKVIAADAPSGPGANIVSDTFNLTVTNSEPVVATPIADQTVAKNTPVNFSIGNAFSDANNDPLTYSAFLANGSPLPSWLSFNSNTGTFTGTPGNANVGTTSIKVIAADAPSGPGANIVSDTFNLTVTNSAPPIATPIADQTSEKGVPFSLSIGNAFSDPDGDPLTYSATLANGSPLPSWLSFNPNTGTFTGTPGNWDVGTISIKAVASDAPASDVTDTFDLTVTNSSNIPPTLANNNSLLVSEGATAAITPNQLLVEDADGDAITYTASTLPASGTLKLNNTPLSAGGTFTQADIAAGNLSYTHSGGETTSDSFSFTATDGGSSTGETIFTFSVTPVNDAPALTAGTVALTDISEEPTTNNGDAVNIAAITSKISDPDAGAVKGIAVTAVDNTNGKWQYTTNGTTWQDFSATAGAVANLGTAARLLSAAATNKIRFVPNANYNGSAGNITFRAWDTTAGTNGGTADTTSNGGATAFSSSTATATLTVTAVNDAPIKTAGNLNNLTVAEDSSTSSLGLAGLAYSAGGGNDETSQTLAYSVTGVPASTLGSIVLADGTTAVTTGTNYTLAQIQGMQFKAAANANGSGTFSFNVTDSGAPTQTLAQSLTVNVTAVNDAPIKTAGNLNNLTVAEDASTSSLGLAGLAYSAGGGVDEASQTLAYSVTGVPASTLGSIVLADGTTAVTTGTNYTLAQIQGMQFKAAANANGSGTFSFNVTDSGAPTQTLAQSLTVNVTAVNDAPIKTAGNLNNLTVAEDSSTSSLGLAGLAYSAGGGNDETSQTLAYSVTGVPASTLGSIVLADGTTAVTTGSNYTLAQIQGMQFKAAANANGSGTFSFNVTDSGAPTQTLAQSLTVNVTAVNDAPIKTAGNLNNLTVAEDSSTSSLGLAGLAYSAGGGNDETSQTLAYSVTGVPASTLGSIVLADGTTAVTTGTNYTLAQIQGMQFKAAANANGSGTFSFNVTDSGAPTQTLAQSLTVNVTAVNDAPIKTAGNLNNLTVAEDASTSSLGLAGLAYSAGGGVDEASQTLAYSVTGVPASTLGSIVLADGTTAVTTGTNYTLAQIQGMQFKAAANANGSGTFSFNVTDSGAPTQTLAQSLTVNVTAVNDAPIKTAGNLNNLTVAEDSSTSSLGLAGLAYSAGGGNDETSQTLAYSVTGVPASTLGSIVLADGTTAVTTGTNYTLAQIQGMQFKAAANANGSGTFSFNVTDSGAPTQTLAQSLTVNVTAVNDAPIKTAGNLNNLTVAEDSSTSSLGLAGLAYSAGGGVDEASQTLAYSVTGVPASTLGSIVLADGTTAVTTGTNYTLAQIQGMQFKAAANANGSGTFSFNVTDSGAPTQTLAQSLTVNVTAVNDAPIKTAGNLNNLTVAEDASTSSLGLAGLAYSAGGGVDEASQTLAYSVTGVPASTLGSIVLADGTTAVTTGTNYTLAQIQGMQFKAAANANGSGTFSFNVTDSGAPTQTLAQSLTVNVTAVNDAPIKTAGNLNNLTVAEDASTSSLGLAGLAYSAGGGVDEASQTLAYSVTGVPASTLGSIVLADGTTAVTTGTNYTLAQIQGMQFKAAANANGSGTFSFNVTDSGAPTQTLAQSLTVNVTAVNDAPIKTAGNLNNLTVAEDSSTSSLGLAGLAYSAGGGNDETSQTLAYSVTGVPASTLGSIVLADGTTAVTTGTNYTLAQIQGMQFKAAANANGSGTFSFNVTDSGAPTQTLAQSLTVNVTAVNDAPIKTAGNLNNLTVAEDASTSSLGLAGLAYSAGGGVDEASQTLAYSVTGVPASTLGSIVLADGTTAVTTGTNYTLAQIQGMQFKAAANANGSGTFSFNVTDSGAPTQTLAQSLTVNVTAVNDAPIKTAGNLNNLTVAEDSSTSSLGLAGLAYSAGGGNDETSQTLAYSVTGVPASTLGSIVLADGTTAVTTGSNYTLAQIQGMQFKAAANANGSGTFSFNVTDSGAPTQTLAQSLTVNVTAVNDAPIKTAGNLNNLTVAEDSSTSSLGLAGLAYSAGGGNDETSQTLAYSVTGVPASTLGSIVLADGTTAVTTGTNYTLAQIQGMQFKAAANANGSGTFSFNVTDSGAPTQTLAQSLTVNVTAVNDAPIKTAGNLNNLTVAEDSSTSSLGLAGLAYSAGGGVDEASQTLAYSVTGVPASTLGSIVLADGTTAVTTGTNYTLAQIQGMQFKAAANANGSGTFSFNVTDSGAPTQTLAQSLTVNVTAVNDAPIKTAGNLNNLTVAEDASTSSLGLAGLAYSAGGGVDEASQTLAYSVTGVPASTLGSIVLADGTTAVTTGTNYTLAQIQGMQFKAAANANGSGTFSFNVTDSGAPTQTLAQSLTVNVTAVNDAPIKTAGNLNNLTVAEDSSTSSLGLAGLAYSAGGGNDETSQTLAYSVTGVPASTLGSIVLADGTTAVTTGTNYTLAQIQGMQFKAAANANGSGTFSFNVTDSGAPTQTLAQSLTVNVTAVNDAPIKTAGNLNNLTVAEDSSTSSLGLAGLAYSAGGGVDEASQTLAYSVTGVPASTLGSIVLADGTTAVTTGTNYTLAQIQGMQFKAAANANGSGTFSFNVTDSGAPTQTLAQSLTVNVTAVNDAPIKTAGNLNNLTVAEDASTSSLGLAGLAYSAGGGVDEASQTLAYSVTGVPASTLGSIVLADGTTAVTTGTNYTLAQIQGMQFKAAANANGSGTFSFNVTDSGAPTQTLAQSLTVNVTAVNDAPIKTAGNLNNLTVAEDASTSSLGLAGLAYSAGGGVDEASQTLAYSVTGVPASTLGSIVLADGTTAVTTGTNYTLAQIQGMQFKAAANANGSGTFSFNVTDSGAPTQTLAQSLTVNVTAVNDAPIKTAGNLNNLTVAEDSSTSSLGLAGLAYSAGGGNDETSQTLAYSVTGVPASTLGSIVLADGTTAVTTGTNYTLAQIQGMQFKAAANANGSGTFSFNVTDSGAPTQTLAQSLTVNVTAVNDAPIKTAGNLNNLTVAEDSSTSSLGLAGLAYSAGGGNDETSQTLAYSVTGVPASTLGSIVLADGTTAVTTGTNYTLAQIQGMQFKAAANANGSGTFSFNVTDSGAPTQTLAQSLTVNVTAVNDAPALTATAVALTGISEDPSTNNGDAVNIAAITSKISDPDAGAVKGIAVTAVDNSNGKWQYTPNGTTWQDFSATAGAVANLGTAARLLSAAATNKIRFVPNANYNGSAGNITFRAWDTTAGTNGGTADTTANGGATAFSSATATATLTVTAVNDAPSFTKGANQTVTANAGAQTVAGWATGMSAGPANEAGQTLNFLVSNNSNSLFAVQPAISATGSLTYSPNASASGSATVSAQLKDNGGTASGGADTSAAQTFTISVNPGINTVTGTAGSDSLAATSITDGIDAAAGNDIVTATLANLGQNDTIDGGTDTDSFVLTSGLASNSVTFNLSAANQVSNITGATVKNFERLNLSGFAGTANITGLAAGDSITGAAGNDTISGTAGNDTLSGDAGNDSLIGGDGNDSLIGGLGTDTLTGGLGNDTIVVDIATDVVTEAAAGGTDLVQSSVSYTLGTEVENLTLTGTAAISGTGNTLNNTISGNAGSNTLSGGAGNDTLSGDAGNDSVIGGDGNDTITGGLGTDTLTGGLGNDTIVVDLATDVVIEAAAGGTDLVQSSVSYTLGTEVENLSLTGTAAISGTGNTLNNTISGNAGSNTLSGGAGNDTLSGDAGNDSLIGGAGNDTLTGGLGNDTIVVDIATDVVIEAAAGGTDLVQSSVSYTLGTEVENLTLTGTAAISGTGNTLNNAITGNAGNNTLSGGAGNDTLSGDAGNDSLIGGDGNDSLIGGAGNDTLTGGLGNDTIVVDIATDVVIEAAAGGTDLVQSSVSYTLGTEVENLTLTGTAAISGTGNTLNNAITGNAGNNTLSGGAGNDTLSGDAGNDSLIGGDGNDTITGGLGTDTLTGGLGNDTIVVDLATDVVIEAAAGGTDLVQSSVSYTLGTEVENLTLTGTAAISGTGNTLNNAITGNAGNNTLSGGAGNDTLSGDAGNDSLIGGDGNDTITGGLGTDTLTGGLGNDTIVVDIATDVVTEAAAGGTDLVQSSVSYTLGTEVENLTLTGTAAISGTGNTLNNAITGNAGNNTLSGGAGNDTLSGDAGNDSLIGGDGNDTITGGLGTDTLTGGLGNDTIVVDIATDVVTEAAAGGTDLVQSSVSYTLGAEVENLSLTGTAAISGTGNTLNNTISGNAGSNTLSGGAGNDTLTGGLGSDRFLYDTAAVFASTAVGVDVIADFAGGVSGDKIILDKTTFTTLSAAAGATSLGAEFATVTTDTAAATSAADIVYNSVTGNLFYNQNGTVAGLGTGAQFAILAGQPVLAATDFIIQA